MFFGDRWEVLEQLGGALLSIKGHSNKISVVLGVFIPCWIAPICVVGLDCLHLCRTLGVLSFVIVPFVGMLVCCHW